MTGHWLDDPSPAPGACNTPGTSRIRDTPRVVAHGVDDVTFGYDVRGTATANRLADRPFVPTRYGRMLGERGQFGWDGLLARHTVFWKPETSRVYVQAKLAPEGELCPPEAVQERRHAVEVAMAVVGIEAYEPAWITRLDVAVDVECDPVWGKGVLDGLAGARLSNGWRVTDAGQPRSTVYFRARAKDTILARAYCRNLKTRRGEPFGLIRLEASDRFDPCEVPADRLNDETFVRNVWEGRYGALSVNVKRIERENQTAQLATMVEAGEISIAQAERMGFFLDVERLGMGGRVYGRQRLSQRRREARLIGLQGADAETVNADLVEVLAPFRSVWLGRDVDQGVV